MKHVLLTLILLLFPLALRAQGVYAGENYEATYYYDNVKDIDNNIKQVIITIVSKNSQESIQTLDMVCAMPKFGKQYYLYAVIINKSESRVIDKVQDFEAMSIIATIRNLIFEI